jgi:mycothiol synthase
VPVPEDVDRLVELCDAQRVVARGSGSVDVDAITAESVGAGSWTRRQLVAIDPSGTIQAWATVHDRAAGRTGVQLVVDPKAPDADELAAGLIAWQEQVAIEIGSERPVEETQLDALIDVGDEPQRGWLAEAGYRKTRTYLNMKRPVDPGEQMPQPRAGVTVRRVGVHELDDGTTMPVAADLQAVHRMLEESFEDHFNSYRESFPEFAQRLREDPGHRWDHWWLALIEDDGEMVPGGALVSSLLTADDTGAEGSYIDYIGVHRRARGKGVAKALLRTVIADAAERGRNRVALEVDADSPTGADGLYKSMGWKTAYVTESWHKDVAVPARD